VGGTSLEVHQFADEHSDSKLPNSREENTQWMESTQSQERSGVVERENESV
jgi:hypothetical protein